MIHPKQHISDLAEYCYQAGVERVIISPGSRNAPLMRAFYARFGEQCHSIVDERSAAYVGLGIARNSGNPVVLICTSGTAVLNFGPALAEAYYQEVPLIAITADRPPESIDQLQNQTIRQYKVFQNYVLYSCQLPSDIKDLHDDAQAASTIKKALTIGRKGPVHINVPLPLPIYDELPKAQVGPSEIEQEKADAFKLEETALTEWMQAKHILVIHGQDTGDACPVLERLLKDPRVVLFAEPIANMQHQKVINNPDLLLALFRNELPEQPDLIIHSGRHMVSKRLNAFISACAESKQWRIGTEEKPANTFGILSRSIQVEAVQFYKTLAHHIQEGHRSEYGDSWAELNKQSQQLVAERSKDLPFSDLSSIAFILDNIPEASVLELGNSNVVRQVQLFPAKAQIQYYSNRGVSGIDGCLSTAVGTALSTKKEVFSIIGDLAFLYDSNALWNKELPANLRIIILNNKGGGIFHQIKGSPEQEGFTQFIEAYHPVQIEYIAKAHGISYFHAADMQALSEQWDIFAKADGPCILEVETDHTQNKEAYRLFTKVL